jgi:hypothetical protein
MQKLVFFTHNRALANVSWHLLDAMTSMFYGQFHLWNMLDGLRELLREGMQKSYNTQKQNSSPDPKIMLT